MTLRQFIDKHKRKIILTGIGVFLGLILNTDVMYLPSNKIAAPIVTPKVMEEKPRPVQVVKRIEDFLIVNRYIREGQRYYTQGLTFKDSKTLIESAGLYEESAIQYIDLETMKVINRQLLDARYFGEGCEYVKKQDQEEIYQLTWREGKILVWDASNLSLKREIDFPNEIKEGWGLVKRYETGDDGKEILNFYISDGSNKIYIVDGETWKVKKTLIVKTVKNEAVRLLNELEFVNGKLWANIYYSNYVAVINPSTGVVDTIIDFTKLAREATKTAQERKVKMQNDYVLNGIAYDEVNNRLRELENIIFKVL